MLVRGRGRRMAAARDCELINPCVAYRNTWSARCENVSPVGRVVWSTAIPSSINAAMGGTSSTGCVPDSSKCKRQDLSVFTSPPSGVASDQGTGPSSQCSTLRMSSDLLCATTARRANRVRSAVAQPNFFLFLNFEIEVWSSCWSKLDNVQFDTEKRQISRWEQLPACQD